MQAQMHFAVFALLSVTFLLQPQVHCKNRDAYIAAVVDYAPAFDSDHKRLTMINLDNYEKHIAEAKERGTDIIVFPENGLTSDYYSVVPSPTNKTIPCTDPLYQSAENGSEIMKRLSCAAKANRIYVAVNLPELRLVQYPNQTIKYAKYNTNVVFNRHGRVVVRYAKYNLFDEVNVDRPDSPEYSFFTSDFGVRFSSFVCFDILFADPPLRLIHEYNVTNFIFTTHWFSELPFLTAISVQEGWAYANNVNMLASGYNDPAEGSTGSGIFHGRNGSLVSVMSEKNETVLLSAPVPKLIIIDENQKPASSTQKKPIESSKLKFLSDRLEVYNSEIIPFGSDYESKICYGRNFCCNFKVRVNEINTNYSNYYYRAVAFDGVRKFGMSTTGGVQVCGVIFCNGPNILNCTSRVSSLEEIHSFQLLEVEGNFQLKNSFQMPSTLVDEGKLAALKPEYYVFRQKTDLVTNKIMMKLIFPIDGLYTFAIWGRDFNRDGHEPSDSPKSVEESSMTSEEEENISSSKSSDSLEKPDIDFSDSSSLASWPRVILVCLTCLIFRL